MLGETSPQLTPLRQELQLSRGAPMLSGERAWIIHDPVRQRYFQIGRRSFELLSAWRNGQVDRMEESHDGGIRGIFTEDEIETMQQFLSQNDLLDRKGSEVSQEFISRNKAAQKGLLTKIVKNYLFFRVPLVRPDRFLRATLPYIELLYTRAFLFSVVLLGIMALYLVSRQWDVFTHTFMQFFTFKGAVLFALTLTFVKTIHELSHGYMAARFGVRVPIMGVAFLLMFPMLYTDVSDAWRLRSRREKVLIDSAGILAELILAVFATLAWVLLPDGAVRSAAFFVATTSWALSLLVNLNPLMRFDGYFIMADSLNITNLQGRSTNLGKWLLREILFGFGFEPPENMPRRNAIWLAFYAWSVWIYRFFLFLGIALFVYHATFKVLGILLFLAEIIWLIAIPIYGELKQWWNMRKTIMGNVRSLVLPAVAIVGLFLLAIPVDQQVSVPAVLKAKDQVQLFAPFPAKVESINVRLGQQVKQGDVLFTLSDHTKGFEIRKAKLRIEKIDGQLSRISSFNEDLANSQVLAREKEKELQTISGLHEQVASLTIRAKFDGRIARLDKDLSEGMAVAETDPMATLVSIKGSSVRGLVAEDDLDRLTTGAIGVFVPNNPLLRTTEVNIAEIANVADAYMEEPYLASVFEGPIAVEENGDKRLSPLAAHYGVVFSAEQAESPSQVISGTVMVDAEPKSYLSDIVKNVLRVMIRESGA